MDVKTTSSNDNDLIKDISDGDEAAFLELYNRYSTSLYNFLIRIVDDEISAEDLVQEVFLAVWYSANRYKGSASVKTWLYKIAHNQAVSWWRRKPKLEEFSDDIPAKSGNNPESMYLDAWRREVIAVGLSHLSHVHRAVIILTFYHGFSYSEIAKIMNCPVGTVKSRMSYARKCLGYELEKLRLDIIPLQSELS